MEFVERKSDQDSAQIYSPFRGAVDQISRNQRPQFKTFHSYTYGKIFCSKAPQPSLILCFRGNGSMFAPKDREPI